MGVITCGLTVRQRYTKPRQGWADGWHMRIKREQRIRSACAETLSGVEISLKINACGITSLSDNYFLPPLTITRYMRLMNICP